jgi:hypothetical protein
VIYIDYQKEKFVIDNTSAVLPVDDPSKLQLKNAAVFLDTSAVSTEDDESCQFYVVRNTDDGKLYFFDSDTRVARGKSLLYALGARENVVVGIYFSKRLLLFAIKDGKLQRPRFTSDDIEEPEYEISYTLKRWGLPENAPVEVYGHNIELSRLFDNIAQSPAYLNRSVVYRAKKTREILLSASLIIMSLGVYWHAHLYDVSIKKNASVLETKTKAIKTELQAEAVKRLPLYLSSSSVPIDAIFRSLSFLESCNYTAINIMVDGTGNINAKVTVINPDDAYKIKAFAKNSLINVTGGVIEVQFTKQAQVLEDAEISGSRNYIGYFSF